MKIIEKIILYFKKIFKKQKRLSSENKCNLSHQNQEENIFKYSIKKESNDDLNKQLIFEKINKNPELIDTLSYSRLIQLNTLYEERINKLKTEIKKLS